MSDELEGPAVPRSRLPGPDPAGHAQGLGLRPVIRSMSLVQHTLAGVLLVVGAVRALLDGTAPLPVALGTVLFVGWYAVGIALTRRPGPAWLPPPLWLLGLTGAWLVLVLVSPEFVWLAFSLWLLAGHLLPLGAAIPASLAVLGVVVAAPVVATGATPGAAGVIGPAVGGLFALALSAGQQRLVHEAVQRARLVESLVASQAESDRLAGELAAAHHEAGILAERTRLSREIHDTLAQGFSSILLLARASIGTGSDPSDSSASAASAEPSDGTGNPPRPAHPSEQGDRRLHLLQQIEECAAENLLEARRVVGALAPEQLQDGGLPAALGRIVETLSRQTGIEAQLRVEGDVGELPTTLEVGLLRAAQGALANVRRHSRARRVVVTLAEAGDSVRLDVVDDGCGFDAAAWALAPPTLPELGGYGLRSSGARLRELGGGLEIESRPGSGTALSAFVPLRSGAPPEPEVPDDRRRGSTGPEVRP